MQKKAVAKSFFASQLSLMLILVFVKIVGFIKQIVLAAVYGTTFGVDVYYLTSGFVGGIAQMFFAAVGVAILPIYTKKLVNEGRQESNRYMSKIFKISLGLAILIAVVFFVFANPLAKMIAPSYSIIQISESARYIRFFVVAILFYCFSNLFSVILDVEKDFVPFRVSGLINSVSFVIVALLLERYLGEASLAVAALVSWCLQLLNIYFFSRKYFKYSNAYRFLNVFHDSEVKELLFLVFPMLMGNAIVEINDLVDKSIATGLTAGTLSVLSYAQILKEFVVFIFITSLGGVLFSYVSMYIAQKKEELVSHFLNQILRVLILVLLPISLYVFLYAADISTVVYMRGNFELAAVEQCAMALKGYSLGFCFIAVRECMNKTHYAYQDTKSPLINGAIAVGGNIISSIVLSRFFGIAGVTIATSIAAGISCTLSLITIKKHNTQIKLFQNKSSFFQMLLAVISSIGVYILIPVSIDNAFVNMILGTAIIFVPYILVLWIMKNEDICYLIRMVSNKAVRK